MQQHLQNKKDALKTPQKQAQVSQRVKSPEKTPQPNAGVDLKKVAKEPEEEQKSNKLQIEIPRSDENANLKSPVSKSPQNKSPSVRIKPEFFVQKKEGSYFDHYSKYTESDVLGEGAYGKVYRVKSKANEQEFAMKIIKKKNLIEDQKEQFLKEIEVLKQLDNPHIVKLYEFYEDENYYYIVQELIHGRELFDEIIERDSFTEQEVANIIKQILVGLNYAHKHNLVHRDIKPENILLEKDSKNSEDWLVKIIDWGVSAHFEMNQPMSQKVGTIEYAAPEVFRKKYNEKCDIWSLGVILYIMLGQAPPFQGTNSRESMEKVLGTQTASPVRLLPRARPRFRDMPPSSLPCSA